MTKFIEKEQFELLKFHFEKDLDFEQIIEIRTVRVLKANKLKYFKNRNYWFLIFYGNDFIGFDQKGTKESHIIFFTISLKNSKQYFLAGIQIDFLNNGTKKETEFCLKPINSILKNLLSTKYDIVTNLDN